MNTTQTAYSNAKSALDAANFIAEKRLAAYDYLLDSEDEKELDKYAEICTQVEIELNIVQLAGNLHNAEIEMINWAIETVSKSKDYTDKYQSMTADIMAHLHLRSIRTKVVALAFQLG